MPAESVRLCPYCPLSYAEMLLDIAEHVTSVEGIQEAEACRTKEETELSLASIRLALDLQKKPGIFRLRAMVEEWDQFRVIREMY